MATQTTILSRIEDKGGEVVRLEIDWDDTGVAFQTREDGQVSPIVSDQPLVEFRAIVSRAVRKMEMGFRPGLGPDRGKLLRVPVSDTQSFVLPSAIKKVSDLPWIALHMEG